MSNKELIENCVLLDQKSYEDLTYLFKMFADSTRLKIFTVLAYKECSVNELTEVLGVTQSAVSHQLSTLRAANLVKYRKDKQTVYYSLQDNHVMMIFKQALEHVKE
ncbi:hypothetical protein AOC36_02780 [Erysipelothrix larvae]|uniref:HTH arsR-type domain-containing protein n=1 Tax=Erysipelothrix larvae TaxID=1514105 RepID=A0A0X8GYU7_9FIRM|nr:metalloregulator ArsR/SmtB family transcription factor [Erysipelothrix larvae]AMC92946.1 hypothetical protein AOC36_02780 [Erysipelothrix larvae]